MLLVVDLSNNNASVDFARLARVPGIAGVYLKASEGQTFTDGTFHERRREANAAGLRVGAYHFGRLRSAGAEARRFVSVVGSLDCRDLRPALDAEVAPGREWVDWTREWNRIVRAELGTGPLFYSYPAWLQELAAPAPLGYGLWLASYGPDDGHEHPYGVPAPWRRAVLHQFTSRAIIAGVHGYCDVSSAPRLGPLLAHPIAGRV